MFSSSLISILYHFVEPLQRTNAPVIEEFQHSHEIASRLLKTIRRTNDHQWPLVPVVGITTDRHMDFSLFDRAVSVGELSGPDDFVFWGRPALDKLVEYFASHLGSTSTDYFDIASKFTSQSPNSNPLDDWCDDLLKKTVGHNRNAKPKVAIAIVDQGDKSQCDAETFDDYLSQADSSGICMSEHAKSVLIVLLERLKKLNALHETQVYCSLVRRPTPPTTKLFDYAGAGELLTAIQNLAYKLPQSIPSAINISMGTHVGPHNGTSPVEQYLAQQVRLQTRWYYHVAAGNDGQNLVHTRIDLPPSVSIKRTANIRPPGCALLLIELWWSEVDSPQVTIDADVTLNDGSNLQQPISITTGRPRNALGNRPYVGLKKGLHCATLFSKRRRDLMRCAAFCLSSDDPNELSGAIIDFTLTSDRPVSVYAWVVYCDVSKPNHVMLSNASQDSTLRVPATEDTVISVTGVEPDGSLWQDSSKGPAVSYQQFANPQIPPPVIGHLAAFNGDAGTSYACARVTAETANLIRDPRFLQTTNDSKGIVREMLRRHGVLGPKNGDVGFGAITR